MVDPVNCTDFSRDDYALEEFLVFCVCVANKTATVIAPAVDRLLNSLPGKLPFEKLKKLKRPVIVNLLAKQGIGCQGMKGRCLYELVRRGLDLRSCTAQDLEEVYGIGQKTSRYFILHTRAEQNCIPLDTHMLKFLRDNGIDAPASAPGSAKRYAELEAHALRFAKERNMMPAEFDLTVWRKYSGNEEHHDADQGTSLQTVHAPCKASRRGQQSVLLQAHRGGDRQPGAAQDRRHRIQRAATRRTPLRRP